MQTSSSPTALRGPLVRRPLAWGIVTALLLSVGFLAGVFLLVFLAQWMRPGEEVRNTQTALLLYARVVLMKALWPHVLLTVPAFILFERTTPLGQSTNKWQCATFMALALTTASIVTLAILPSEIFELARVSTGGLPNTLATIIEIATATTAAATAANWLLNRRTHP